MKRALIVPAVFVVLIVLTGIRSGLVPALILTAMVVVLLGGSAWAVYRIGKAQAARIAAATAPATQPVKHCDCCDRACLTAAICAPGAEPLVKHDDPAVAAL